MAGSDDSAGESGRESVGELLVGIVLVLVGALLLAWLTPLDTFLSGVTVAVAALAGYAVYDRRWARTVARQTGLGWPAWVAGALLYGGGLALTYLFGDPVPFCQGDLAHRGCLNPYGYGAVAYLVGCFGLAVAAGHRRRYRRLAGVETAPAAEVEPGAPTAVEGRVESASETLTAPLSGEPAVWYRYAHETPRIRGVGHSTRDCCGDAVQFYVADASGRLLVVPDDADAHLLCEHAHATTVPAAEAPAVVRDCGPADAEADGRYREWSLRPDDPVVAAGRPDDLDRAAWPAPVGLGVGGDVVLAGTARDDAAGTARWRVLVGTGAALLLGGGGLAIMVLTAVPL